MQIKSPYLVFLGDAPDQLAAKVGNGIAVWARDKCIGQFVMEGCKADIGLESISLAQAKQLGAQTLVVGVANRGGIIAQHWIKIFEEALDFGFDIAAGLHNRLNDIPSLHMKAKALKRSLFDVRYPNQHFEVAAGSKRTGKRLLTVGSDCSVGKMFTSLAIEKALKQHDIEADFRATGQTGILICGSGVSIDAVIADFISGATESISPANDSNHWDIIEGQGSLFHASFAGVSLGLIHGAQPDALVLCHEPNRPHMRGLPDFPLPDLQDCIALNLEHAKLVNPACKMVGVSINTIALSQAQAEDEVKHIEDKLQLPTTDCMRFGAEKLIKAILY